MSTYLPKLIGALAAKHPSNIQVDRNAKTLRLVARSPNEPIAQVVWSNLEQLGQAGVEVKAMFRRVRSVDAIQKYAAVYGEEKARTNIRFTGGKGLELLNEQAIFGEEAWWIGNTLNKRGVETDDGIMRISDSSEAMKKANSFLTASYEMNYDISKSLAEDWVWKRRQLGQSSAPSAIAISFADDRSLNSPQSA